MGRSLNRKVSMRQFEVGDDRSAMKVGTDALLLGAWSRVEGAQRILDIGTGSGIVLLMAAQRADARSSLTGIDLDPDACAQARENVARSPFEANIFHADALKWIEESNDSFDVMLCNPPFFRNKPLGPDSARNLARHDFALPIEKLMKCAAAKLTSNGSLNLVWPADRLGDVMNNLESSGFAASEICEVVSRPGLAPLRVLLELVLIQPTTPPPRQTQILIEDAPRQEGGPPLYSDQYQRLLAPYIPQFKAVSGS
jgi:tRNA1Val (adenine37-N6)-methyltransferase